MKLPIMLRSTHEAELVRATNIITEKNRVIAVKKDELAVERKINATTREKVNKLQVENSALKSNLEELELKFKELDQANEELETKLKELDQANIELINLFNDANRKNWCNNESSRQLKKLAKEILEADKINKTYLASYINDISKYVGGGIPREIKIIDEDIKE